MNCKQYVFQLTSGQLGEANLPQRLAAGMHRMMCVHCRRFSHNDAVLYDILAARKQAAVTLGAYRTLGVESENAPQRGPFLPDSPPHSGAMGQEDGKKWAAAAHSQPTIPKSDRPPEAPDSKPD